MQGIRLFGPEILGTRAVSHAAVPVPLPLDDGTLRVFVSSRDEHGRSLAYFVDLDPENLKVVDTSDGPILDLGERGCFDEHGVMPSSALLGPDGRVHLYYVGWNRDTGSVPYRVSIGCAVSEDASAFARVSNGPVLDRNPSDPIFVTTPSVRYDRSWTMLYSTASKWEDVDARPEPFYHLARASSSDGIEWRPQGTVEVGLNSRADAITRPTLFDHEGKRVLAFCHRSAADYRTDAGSGYRIGFASLDDDGTPTLLTGDLDLRDEVWASSMRCYPSLVNVGDRVLMLYNGDGFGATGVVAAWLPSSVFEENR